MENRGVEELVVHLDQALDLTSMEQGVKLIGKVLTSKLVNKWGVRNILRSTWKDLGEVDIKWVRDNTFLILVQDESMASKILEQVPWAVMKKVFSVKKWPPELALEEVKMETVPFWVQIRGVPLGSMSATNIQCLTQAAGQFIALEDPGKARGFLRVRILIDTGKPLCNGCWIRRDKNRDTWVDFRYERLQDFCYRCGRIGHGNTECSFQVPGEGAAAYGEWTKAPPVRDVLEPLRTITGSSQKKWRRKQQPLVLTGQASQKVGDEDRPSLPQVEIGGSSPNKSGSQQEGPANTEDVFIVNGAAE
ncbi:hypothetical protein ACFX1X_008744 [Malus domestica]